MTRVKRGNVARKRRKKYWNLPKDSGVVSLLTSAPRIRESCRRWGNSYRDRRNRKRDFRRLWITRINAAARINGISYSQLVGNMKKADILLNRKMLAQLAVLDPQTFGKVVDLAKSANK